MRPFFILLLFLVSFLLASNVSLSQINRIATLLPTSYEVSSAVPQVMGIVREDKTEEPISGVDVFINKTTIAATSDESGKFQWSNVPPGFIDVIMYKKGYLLYQSSMLIQPDRSYALNLTLVPGKVTEGKGKVNKEALALVRNILAGENAGADQFPGLNELDIIVYEDVNGLKVDARDPVTILNLNTGLRIICFIPPTDLQKLPEVPLKFEYLPARDMSQAIQYEAKRQAVFEGSLRYWLRALVQNKLSEEGFSMMDEQGNPVEGKDILKTSTLPGYFRISLDKTIVVNHFDQGGAVAMSRISCSGPVDLNEQGVVLNPKLLQTEGAMKEKAIAFQLPRDFSPINEDLVGNHGEMMLHFYEKVYLHTDKPYYYPGERLWFKAYLNYHYPAWRDSLSKVLYVELFNSDKVLQQESLLKIDSGFARGDFILPDTLKAGTYYLRAYTSLQRNFGDDQLFVKPLPLFNLNDKADPVSQRTELIRSNHLTISSEWDEYKTRDKIGIMLAVKDKEGKPLAANISVSVTDAAQVIKIPEETSIIEQLVIRQEKITKITDLANLTEYGFGIRGRFLNNEDKPEEGLINVFQLKSGTYLTTVADGNGIFNLRDLQFNDTATFSFNSIKATDHPYGKVILMKREKPALNFISNESPVPVLKTSSIQRIISEYEVPKGTTLLPAVEVNATRIEENSALSSKFRGNLDRLLTPHDLGTDRIGYPNLLYYLQGKVPGLMVTVSPPSIYFTRSASASITSGGAPLILVDDAPMGGDPALTLTMIDPNSVEAIGIKKGLDVIWGSQGRNGIIKIYLKHGAVDGLKPVSNFQQIKVTGFSSPHAFRFPNYYDPKTDASMTDFRSTLYWNPVIKTNAESGKADFFFFAADLPGIYRVSAEGMTADGEPLKSEYLIRIVSR